MPQRRSGRGRGRERAHVARRSAAAAAFVAAGAIVAIAAARATAAEIAIAPIAGASRFDASLSRYGWAAETRALIGAEAAVRERGWGAGLRAGRSSVAQSSALLGAPLETTVRLWTVDAFAEMPLVSFGGVRVAALGAIGQVFASYSPDRALIASGGSGGAVEVRYGDWNEWSVAGGLALRAPVTGALESCVALERCAFRLDTAHRQGDAIVESRETFGGWVARAGLTWRMGIV